MQFLTLEQILQVHAIVLLHDGGAGGVRDIGRLESVVATQHQEIFGKELYQTVFEKSAAIIRGIVNDHPFSDGNKRTAMLVGLTFLEINGYHFIAKQGELEDFAVDIATKHLSVYDISKWLEKRVTSKTRLF